MSVPLHCSIVTAFAVLLFVRSCFCFLKWFVISIIAVLLHIYPVPATLHIYIYACTCYLFIYFIAFKVFILFIYCIVVKVFIIAPFTAAMLPVCGFCVSPPKVTW